MGSLAPSVFRGVTRTLWVYSVCQSGYTRALQGKMALPDALLYAPLSLNTHAETIIAGSGVVFVLCVYAVCLAMYTCTLHANVNGNLSHLKSRCIYLLEACM